MPPDAFPLRPLEIATFLDSCGWNTANVDFLRGDFSTRRYARLTKVSGETAFLMDADKDQNTDQFIRIAGVLRELDVKAPEIYASDADKGLVLMQDFGSRPVGRLLDAGEPLRPFFLRAAEVLALVHRDFSSTSARDFPLPLFDTSRFVSQAELFLDAYLPIAIGREASDEEREEFRAAWKTVLRPIEELPRSLLLRDFMPDNLMDLPDGSLGVLDFQDAGIGPVAYDLASLCEEVRRDGGFALLPDVIFHYREVSKTSVSAAELLSACTVLSAQRHIRILGIVVRLSRTTVQCEKFAFLPRIRKHLKNVLSDPSLIPVKAWIDTFDRSFWDDSCDLPHRHGSCRRTGQADAPFDPYNA